MPDPASSPSPSPSETPAYQAIRIDRPGDRTAEVVLNRPEKLNAMAPVFFEEIGRAFAELDADASVRAVVLRAEGRMFTAGLDLKAAGTLLAPTPGRSAASQNLELLERVRSLQDRFTAIERCRKPVVAAVHGHCIGGGVDLVTACDVILATADATFSIQETKIAIVADLGTLQRIGRRVGRGPAREMAFTGRRLTADRALGFGLVNEVYPDQEALLAGARAMAREIAANSPLVVQGTKAVLNFSESHSVADGLEYVALWNAAFLRSDDLTEAVTAFLTKREPNFKGS